MTKEQAMQTGERLEHLETWMRYVFAAVVACAGMLLILTTIAIYAAHDYMQAKAALGNAAAGLSSVGDEVLRPSVLGH